MPAGPDDVDGVLTHFFLLRVQLPRRAQAACHQYCAKDNNRVTTFRRNHDNTNSIQVKNVRSQFITHLKQGP